MDTAYAKLIKDNAKMKKMAKKGSKSGFHDKLRMDNLSVEGMNISLDLDLDLDLETSYG